MTDPKVAQRIGAAIDKALAVAYRVQDRPKRRALDDGGWRYWTMTEGKDADFASTSWHLMLLRSAKNAGFAVPSERIDKALRFMLSCQSPRDGGFRYYPIYNYYSTRTATGGGILALAHAGMFDHDKARRAGDWLLAHPYRRYPDGSEWDQLFFHYSFFYTMPAMYQLGGQYWEKFFPPTVDLLLRH